MRVRVRAYVCVCMYACVRMSMCVYACVRACICVSTCNVCMRARACASVRACLCACVPVYQRACANVQVCQSVPVCQLTCSPAWLRYTTVEHNVQQTIDNQIEMPLLRQRYTYGYFIIFLFNYFF